MWKSFQVERGIHEDGHEYGTQCVIGSAMAVVEERRDDDDDGQGQGS